MTNLSSRAFGQLTSFVPADRTVEAYLATETPVRRYDLQGEFDEVLLCNSHAIETTRLDSMALLDSHRAQSLEARLGSVVSGSLRFEHGKALVTIKLSRNPKAEAIFRDLEDGHRFSVSVGYQLLEIERNESPLDGVPVVRATRWQPMELSIVNVPADPNATTRANPTYKEIHMTETLTRADRVQTIRAIAELVHLDKYHHLLRQALAEDMDVEQFRAAVLDHLVEEQEKAPTFPHSSMRGMVDETDTRRRLAANSLMHRHGLTAKLEDGAQEYRGLDTVGMMRKLLDHSGQSSSGSPREVIERSLHTTSDFPSVMNTVVHATLSSTYEAATETFNLISNRNVVQDLREVHIIEMGDAPSLEKVSEKGEYKRGSIRESGEGFTMAHYGKVFGLTEAMLINDQLGAFARAIAAWGRQVARLEGDIVWNAALNGKLKSGNTLFHADHNNMATSAALSQASVIEARKLFRKQKDLDGNLINVSPKYLFVGTDHEITAQMLTQASTAPQTADQAIPEAIRSLVPVYEPRIDAILSEKAWMLFASVEDTMGRGLQHSYLSGFETPRLKERWGFDYDGVEYRIDHYFGAGITDYRFAVQNAGT